MYALTLLIPHLFWPRDAAEAALGGAALPALEKLVARSRRERFAAVTTDAWLCQAFEVEKQQDWPVAPLTLELDGGEAGSHYWLRADPVHLRVARESVTLVDNALFDLNESEAKDVIASLNAHFSGDGLVFHCPAAKRWYVRAQGEPRLLTMSLGEVAGRDVQTHLPTGHDAGAWHRIFNEVQMLLHGHSVNEARESRGAPAVNSVWLWGGGTRPRVPGRPFAAVWGNDALACALAASSDTAAAARPDGAASWFGAAGRGHARHLVVLDELAMPTAYQDAEEWRERLLALEARWFAPLADALRAGAISELVLVAPLASACWRFEARRGDLLKLWRRGEPLTHYG
jgi:hypothetical protein